MKKLVLLASAALLVTSLTFANTTDKGKKKCCGKGKACCKKSGTASHKETKAATTASPKM